jgi:hypothetical protein
VEGRVVSGEAYSDDVIAELIELDALTPAVPPLVSDGAKRAFELRQRQRNAPEFARSIEAQIALIGVRAPNVKVQPNGITVHVVLSCPLGCTLYDVPNAVRIGPVAEWAVEGDPEPAIALYLEHMRWKHNEVPG